MTLSVLIPVFNERNTIKQALDNVITADLPLKEYEIVVVDDGSTDGTKEIIEKYLPASKAVIITKIYQDTNSGKGAAIRKGIEAARGEYIIIQDADLEYDPKYIPHLLKELTIGKKQAIFGTRLNRWPNIFKEENKYLFLFHYIGNRLLSLLVSLLYGVWLTDIETCYKLFPKQAFTSNPLTGSGFNIEPEITIKLIKQGYTIKEIPITTTPRDYSQGKKLNTIPAGIEAVWTILKYRFSK